MQLRHKNKQACAIMITTTKWCHTQQPACPLSVEFHVRYH